MKQSPYVAKWWEKADNGKLLCTLCPRFCTIGEGQRGFCYVRVNKGGVLYNEGYGTSSGFAVDPIEKKPLFHFLPGSTILSFGTVGCNLGCKFCQNHSISKVEQAFYDLLNVTPENIIDLSRKTKAPSIAITYNDPVIIGEFVSDIAYEAHIQQINTVLVTAGYITEKVREQVFRFVKAANVDLKGFTESFYREYTGTHLQPVLETLVWLKHKTNIWFEITTLLIPGVNDSDAEIIAECEWIYENLGSDVPLHFSGFHPDYKMQNHTRTEVATILRAVTLAKQVGLNYVYGGNVHNTELQTTFCSHCGEPLIVRDWHNVLTDTMVHGTCPHCNMIIPGVFN